VLKIKKKLLKNVKITAQIFALESYLQILGQIFGIDDTEEDQFEYCKYVL